jgi:O-antigen ligase
VTASYSYPVSEALANSSDGAGSGYFWIFVLLGAHIPLGYLMHLSSQVATIHALVILVIGLWFVSRDQQPFRLVYLTGYIAGADVLWRMTEAGVLWEFGKYAICLLFILGLFKWKMSSRGLPLLYLLLLIPAVLLTFLAGDSLGDAKRDISFNLSGPITLAIAVVFFSGVKLDKKKIWRLLLYTIMPMVSILFLALLNMYIVKNIEFSLNSNFLTSGGFGPNQVSAILGLGALLCWIFIVTQDNFNSACWLISGLMITFLIQSMLTFSRGGLANFLVAVLFATPFLVAKRRKVLSVVVTGLIILALFVAVIIPKMENFTHGDLGARFTDTSTTGRWQIIKRDLELWQENFLFGVGPGRSATERYQIDRPKIVGPSTSAFVAAHSEYTRLLAEHGVLGLMAFLLLGFMFLQAWLRAPTPLAKGLTLAFMLWSLAEMGHAAMRLAAISFFYALPFANFDAKE